MPPLPLLTVLLVELTVLLTLLLTALLVAPTVAVAPPLFELPPEPPAPPALELVTAAMPPEPPVALPPAPLASSSVVLSPVDALTQPPAHINAPTKSKLVTLMAWIVRILEDLIDLCFF